MSTILTPSALFECIKAQGIPFDSHESDLYIPVNDATRELIAQYQSKRIVTTFVSQIDGQRWYDVPFAYAPFWEAKAR